MGWSWEIPQKLFQDDAGRCGVGILGATGETGSAARPLGVGFGGAVALVHLKHLKAKAAAQLAAYDLDDQTFDRFVPLVEHLTPEQVTAAAREFIRPDALKIVVAGDPDLCGPQLESLGRRVSVTAPEF